jgi:hypothetical protein
MATVAKKASSKARGDDIVILTLKCRREWRDWALDLAAAERASLATLIDQLLAERARQRGLKAPPARGKG